MLPLLLDLGWNVVDIAIAAAAVAATFEIGPRRQKRILPSRDEDEPGAGRKP